MPGYIPKALDKFQHPAPTFHNTVHTNGTDQFMAGRSNMQLPTIICLLLMHKEQNKSRPLFAPSSTTPEP
eukprot:1768227-Ditylum_brightwellii.AAC.1